MDPLNTHQKNFWIHEITTRKNLDRRSTNKKNNWTQEIPTAKSFEPIKCRREKNLDIRNIQEKEIFTKKYRRMHASTMALDSQDSEWKATH